MACKWRLSAQNARGPDTWRDFLPAVTDVALNVKETPQLLSSTLQLFPTKRKKTLRLLSERSYRRMGLVRSPLSRTRRRRWRGAYVLVRVWPPSRLRHMSRHPEVSLLCQRAQLTYKSNMSSRKKPRVSSQAHIWSYITHPDPPLNWSCATLRDANNRWNNFSWSHSKFWHEDHPKPATPTLRTGGQHDPYDSRIQLCRQTIPTF